MIRNECWGEREGERKAVSGTRSAAYDNISHPVLSCIVPLGVIIGAWIWRAKRVQKMLVWSIYVESDLFQSCQECLWSSGSAGFTITWSEPGLTQCCECLNTQPACPQSLNTKHTHAHIWNNNPHVNYQVPFQRTFASLAVLIIIVVCISLRDRESFFSSPPSSGSN